jgi:hypothetical protein
VVGVSGLTARELEVLGLAATGRTDREIAEVLFLSPRTIHHHMANVLAGFNPSVLMLSGGVRSGGRCHRGVRPCPAVLDGLSALAVTSVLRREEGIACMQWFRMHDYLPLI